MDLMTNLSFDDRITIHNEVEAAIVAVVERIVTADYVWRTVVDVNQLDEMAPYEFNRGPMTPERRRELVLERICAEIASALPEPETVVAAISTGVWRATGEGDLRRHENDPWF